MDIQQLNQRVELERACAGCPLQGKTFVGMDADASAPGPARRILFLGLNPGLEEAAQKQPFVGKSGRFLRDCLAKTGCANWAMVNSILCSTGNQAQIPDEQLCHQSCYGNLAMFVRQIQPLIIAPCGNGAASRFGLGTGISKNCKLVFLSRGRTGKAKPTLVMPIKHPSALIRAGGVSAPDYQPYLQRLRQIQEISAMLPKTGFDESWLGENHIEFLSLFNN